MIKLYVTLFICSLLSGSHSSLSNRQTQTGITEGVSGNMEDNAADNMDVDESAENITQICNDFQDSIYDEYASKFMTQCACTESISGGYAIACEDNCESCFGEVCNVYSTFNQLGNVDGELVSEMFYQCIDFSSHADGVKMCLNEDLVDIWFTVNDEKCDSVKLIDCGDESVGHILDCSNLGYGKEINLCDGSKLDGHFAYWHDILISNSISNLDIGKCTDDTLVPRKGGGGRGGGGRAGGSNRSKGGAYKYGSSSSSHWNSYSGAKGSTCSFFSLIPLMIFAVAFSRL